MDGWPPSTSDRRRGTFNRRRATFNRRPGIKPNFRQTVELYLWVLGDSRNETMTANSNINAQSSDGMALERMKESNGDSSLAAENKTSKQDHFISSGKFLPAIEVTMAGVQCREPNVKSKMTFREKLYNWTTGALKNRGKQLDTKVNHTMTGAETASEWIIPEMVTSCSSTCHTKTAYEGTSKKTLKESLEPTMYHIKSYLLTSGGSDPKRSSSEPTMYDIEFPYIGIQEELFTCRVSSEYKHLAESSADGSLKSIAPKRAASCSAVFYAKPAYGGIPAGFFPKKILLRSSIHCTKPAEETTLDGIDPQQGSRESILSYTIQAADDAEENIVQNEMSSKSKMQYINPAEVFIPDGTAPKKLLLVSGNDSADEGDREGVDPKLVLSECALCYSNSLECLAPKRAKYGSTTHNTKPHVETSQEASHGNTSGQYSSAADIAAAGDIGATVYEKLCSQSRKNMRNTERKHHLRRDNSQKKKGATSCLCCYPR